MRLHARYRQPADSRPCLSFVLSRRKVVPPIFNEVQLSLVCDNGNTSPQKSN